MIVSKYEWLFTGCTIAWAVGAGLSISATLAKRKLSKEVRYANWDTLFCTAVVCVVMTFVYLLMAIGVPPYQRADGVEVVWYRDAALALATTVGVYITAVVCQTTGADGVGATLLTAIGSVAVFGGNAIQYQHDTAPKQTLTAFIPGALVVVGAHLIIALRMNSKTWLPRLTLLAQAAAFLCLALVQLLSWSMTEAFERAPHRFVSEIVYGVATIVAVGGVGVLASASMPTHSHSQ